MPYIRNHRLTGEPGEPVAALGIAPGNQPGNRRGIPGNLKGEENDVQMGGNSLQRRSYAGRVVPVRTEGISSDGFIVPQI